MAETLSINELKSFFSEFLAKYKEAIEKDYFDQRGKFALFSSMPIKVDLLLDKEMRYGVILLSKKGSGFDIDASYQDPMMVVASANYKKYEYGEKGNFLYLFQVNAKRFASWTVDGFVKDFVNYELTKDSFK